jgi:hypothetical protein
MPRLRRLHRPLRALAVADLTNKNDFRVLSHGVANTRGERVRINSHLALLELAVIFFEQILDRVFDRDDAQLRGFVELLQQGTSRRALSLPGRSGDKDKTARLSYKSRSC